MDNYNYKTAYDCSPSTQSKHFSRLQYMIIKSFPYTEIQNYESQHIDEINYKNKKGWTALMICCRNSNTIDKDRRIMNLLLKSGADVNLQNNNSWTALMMASRYNNTTGNTETIKILLEYGANVNLQNNEDCTALILASKHSSNDIVRLLLKHDAVVDLKTHNRSTALIYASQYCNTNTVKLLLEYGADVNDNNNNHETPLIMTLRSKNENTVKLLLQHNANMHLTKNLLSNYTTDKKMIKLLLDYGYNLNDCDSHAIIQKYGYNKYIQYYYYYKYTYELLLKQLAKKIDDYLYKPTSIRSRIVILNLNLQSKNYNNLEELKEYSDIINYIGINDIISLKEKINLFIC